LVAYDAKTGREVWSFKTVSPVVAQPISYAAQGRQYVSVITGSGSQGGGILATGNAAYRTDYTLPRRLLTFSIGGAARLPHYEMQALTPPADPDFKPDPEQVMAGALAFANNACLVCHGMNAIGGGAAPDLRYSPLILNARGFKAVVKDGVLKPRGMPPSPHISDADLEDMRHYLRMRAVQSSAEAAASQAAKTLESSGQVGGKILTHGM
jgi:quinohemoprotein ethanol dehydrogenase